MCGYDECTYTRHTEPVVIPLGTGVGVAVWADLYLCHLSNTCIYECYLSCFTIYIFLLYMFPLYFNALYNLLCSNLLIFILIVIFVFTLS